MSKKKKIIPRPSQKTDTAIKPVIHLEKTSILFPFMSYRMEVAFLAGLAALLYANTFNGDYVLDDMMAITHNRFVQEGFAGIKDIFTTDSISGFISSVTDLSGGRYRPFALMSFAIENSLWGNNPHISHLINIILWTSLSFVLFKLLRTYFFKNNPDIAFLSALVFVIHPIHTEVIANLKSRDELFSMLFLLSSTFFLFKYINSTQKNKSLYLLSIVLYFLALLSKENGITYVILLPLMLYFFSETTNKKIIRLILPYIGVLVLFLVIRFGIIGANTHESSELLNNPFLNTTYPVRVATIMFCLLKYLGLLFFPYPQSYDYSFNQVQITGFDNPFVLFSLMMHILLLTFAALRLKRKNVIAFCILFYMISIFIVSNLAVNIGALMGERLLFQPSLAFSIFIGYAVVQLATKIEGNKFSRTAVAVFLLTALIFTYGYFTVKRNADWKTEYALFLKDVKTSPNSTLANLRAGVVLINHSDAEKNPEIKKKQLLQSLEYFHKATEIFSGYPDPHTNACIALMRLDNLEDAGKELAIAKKTDPTLPTILELEKSIGGQYYNLGVNESGNKNFEKAVYYFEKATEYDPSNAQYWFDLSGTSCMIKNYAKGYDALIRCVQINPGFKNAQMGLDQLKSMGVTSAHN